MSAIQQVLMAYKSISSALVQYWVKVFSRETSNSISWLNNKAIITGNSGSILTSTDGINWVTQHTGVFTNLNDAAWTGTNYVVVGASGTVLTSADSTTWSSYTAANTFVAVESNGTITVAGTSAGAIYTSSDNGLSWTLRSQASPINNIVQIVWNGSIFLAIGGSATTTVQISTSPDGITWTKRTAPALAASGTVADACWTGTQFSALVGTVTPTNISMNSADGITWTNTTISGTTASPLGITWGGDRIVAAFNGGTAISTNNGTTWTFSNSVTPGIVCWDGTKLLAALSIGSTFGHSTSLDGLSWAGTAEEVSPAANGPGQTAFTYVNSTYLSASNTANLNVPYTSTDNITWTRGRMITYPGTAVFMSFFCTGGSASYYVAGGVQTDSGSVQTQLLYTSTDGRSWTLRNSSFGTSYLRAVASNGTVTVITGTAGARRYSTDGIGATWTATTGAATAGTIGYCIWANSQFVSLGDNYVAISSDGITWTAGTITITSASSLVWDSAHSVYIAGGAAGAIRISSNGTTWSSVTISGMGTVTTLVTNGSRVVAMSGASRVAAYSDNGGSTWTTYTLPSEQSTTAAVYDGSKFIAVGNNGPELTSTDGITWAHTQRALTNNITGLFVVSQDTYLAVEGNAGYPNRVFSTTNAGKTWDWNYVAGSPNLYDIHYNGSQYVAVGGITAGTVGKIYTSTDLITWTTITTTAANNFKSIAYSGSIYVAVANNSTSTAPANGTAGTIWSSPDGSTWTQRSPSTSFNRVKWLGGQFIAVVSNSTTSGTIYTSSDGINWTSRYSLANALMIDVAYSGTTYVVVAAGTTNKIFTSPDGINWTPRMTSAIPTLERVEYGAGVFMAATIASGSYISTDDGITWTSLVTNTALGFSTLNWDTDRFIAFNKTQAALLTYIP
jgi:hypothetical protein